MAATQVLEEMLTQLEYVFEGAPPFYGIGDRRDTVIELQSPLARGMFCSILTISITFLLSLMHNVNYVHASIMHLLGAMSVSFRFQEFDSTVAYFFATLCLLSAYVSDHVLMIIAVFVFALLWSVWFYYFGREADPGWILSKCILILVCSYFNVPEIYLILFVMAMTVYEYSEFLVQKSCMDFCLLLSILSMCRALIEETFPVECLYISYLLFILWLLL